MTRTGSTGMDADYALSRAESLQQAGLASFEAGDFDAARSALLEAVRGGVHDPDTISLLANLIADRDGAQALASFYRDVSDRYGHLVAPASFLEWAIGRFDAILAEPLAYAEEEQAAAALDLLASAATARSWDAVPDRRIALDAMLSTPSQRLDLLEQLVYAPQATGLPATAAAEIEALGYRLVAEGDLDRSRAAERLLHGIRHTAAAYRVEAARRQMTDAQQEQSPDSTADREFNGLVVLIAGGHPPLRRMVSIDLKRSGARGVREVPSKWEAVQSGRSVNDRMAGSDLAVLIGRQLAHSTADQVRTAAARYGVPLARAETAGVGSIRRAALGARR